MTLIKLKFAVSESRILLRLKVEIHVEYLHELLFVRHSITLQFRPYLNVYLIDKKLTYKINNKVTITKYSK